MGQRVLDRDLAELLGRPAAEGPARCGEEEAATPRPCRRPSMQALVQRAVLRVDGDDLGARSRPRLLHHGCGGDQRLLVGQGQPLARLERGQRHRQPGEPDDPVEHHVRLAGRLHHALGADEHLGAGGHAGHHVADSGRGRRSTTTSGRNSWPGPPGPRPSAARPAAGRGSESCSLRMTSSACVPIEPEEPIRLTERISSSEVERLDREVRGREDEEQAVHPVEHAAMPGQDATHVLDARGGA